MLQDNIQSIYVGKSDKNCHHLLDTQITQEDLKWRGRECVVFSYSIDDIVLKKMIFTKDKNGNPDTPIKLISKLNTIKSLQLK